MKEVIKALGYVRVSTEQQVDVGDSLQTQIGEIKEWAARNGFDLIGIYGDTGSARKDRGARERKDLSDLIKRANREKAAIVVTRWDRLSRSEEGIRKILKQLPHRRLFAIEDDDNVHLGYGQKHSVIIDRVRTAEDEAVATATATGQALARKNARGDRLGAPGDQRRNTLPAIKANIDQANIRAEEIARILLDDPAHMKLSNDGLASLLNAKGLKTKRDASFDRYTVRKPRQRALDFIREQQELAAEIDAGPFADGMISTDDFGSGLSEGIRMPPVQPPKPTEHSGPVVAVEADDANEDYKDVPLFGMF